MDDAGTGASEDALLAAVRGPKRSQVPAACERCRQNKSKCDGRRPCSRCRRLTLQCVFGGKVSETPRQTLKRRYDEFNNLYDTLRTGEESHALQILSQIRSGQPIETILQSAEHRRSVQDGGEEARRQKFLMSLVQTTAPLADVISLAKRVLHDSQFPANLPKIAMYRDLRDSVIDIGALAGVLKLDNWPLPTLGRSLTPTAMADGFNGSPPHWIQSQPWTTVTQSDHVVSHLVSTFLAMVNGYWRMLEQDLFLKAARKGQTSEYCSSFLINAILACASLFSEIDAAFASPEKMLTRGAHFHQEAVRLWTLRSEQPSIATVQALFVMAMDCSIRGHDKRGLEFSEKAVLMHKALASHAETPAVTEDEVNYKRARQCLAWTVVWMDFSYALGLLSPFESIQSSIKDAPYDLDLVLPDTVVYWTTFPLLQEPIPLRMNMLLRQRCKLNVIIARVMKSLFSNPLRERHRIVEGVASLTQAVTAWCTDLPTDLSYKPKMPLPLFEFHGQYLSVQMTLHNRALDLLLGSDLPVEIVEVSSGMREYINTLHRDNLRFAHLASQYLRDFRNMYGYKITPTAVMHPAAVAATVLLRNMSRTLPLPKQIERSDPPANDSSPYALEYIHSSFEECFRCLLGMGMQNLLPRAIARMIYRASSQLQMQLPENVLQMLQIVSESSWRASDLGQLDSIYPNWTLPTRSGDGRLAEQVPYWLHKWETLANDDNLITADQGAGSRLASHS